MSLRGAVFDLDDTLYIERQYVASGLGAVAAVVGDSIGADRVTLYEELQRVHNSGHRGRVFDEWLSTRPDLAARFAVASLVDAYRAHQPTLSLLPGLAEMIEALRRRGIKLGVISDGYVRSQTAKVAALGLNSMMDRIVLTDEWGAAFWKPHPRAFELIESEWNLDPATIVYIADNPHKDFLAPNSRGWMTIRLRLAGQLWQADESDVAEGSATIEVDSIASLAAALVERA